MCNNYYYSTETTSTHLTMKIACRQSNNNYWDIHWSLTNSCSSSNWAGLQRYFSTLSFLVIKERRLRMIFSSAMTFTAARSPLKLDSIQKRPFFSSKSSCCWVSLRPLRLSWRWGRLPLSEVWYNQCMGRVKATLAPWVPSGKLANKQRSLRNPVSFGGREGSGRIKVILL